MHAQREDSVRAAQREDNAAKSVPVQQQKPRRQFLVIGAADVTLCRLQKQFSALYMVVPAVKNKDSKDRYPAQGR